MKPKLLYPILFIILISCFCQGQTADTTNQYAFGWDLDSEMLQSYPIYDIDQLLKLHPGVAARGNSYYMMGSLPIETGYYLDGVYLNDPYTSLFSGYIPFSSLDQVQFKIGNGDPSVYSSGGSIYLLTKTGGEQFSVNGKIISDQFILPNQIQSNVPLVFSYGYRLLSASVSGPLFNKDLLRFYGSFEQFNTDDAIPTFAKIPLIDKSYLNPLNGMPDNGEPFTDVNQNTVWDSDDWLNVNEPFIDTNGNNDYDRPDYDNLETEAISFEYGPKSGNWMNRSSMNGNLVLGLKPILGFDLNVRIGGSRNINNRSHYDHGRQLFNYYNDASTKDGIGTTGELKSRFMQSLNTTFTQYGRISGEIPFLNKSHYFVQLSRYENRYKQFDPVLKDGGGHWWWNDGTVSDETLPFLQYAKEYDLSNHSIIYQSNDGSYIESGDWLSDTSLAFDHMEYDTTWINPLYYHIGQPSFSGYKWAFFGVAGQPVSDYKKSILGHRSLNGKLQFKIKNHEITTGFEYRQYDIRHFSITDIYNFGSYMLRNNPYSPDQDIYSEISQNNYVYLELDYYGDGIPDYLQDKEDVWDNKDLDEDGDVDHDDYFLNYINNAAKSAYVENTGFDILGNNKGIKPYSPFFGNWYISDSFKIKNLKIQLGLHYNYFNPTNKMLNPETGGVSNIVIDMDGELADTVYAIDRNNNGVLEPNEYQLIHPTNDDPTGKPQFVNTPILQYWNPQIEFQFLLSKSTNLYFHYKTFTTFPPPNLIDNNYGYLATVLIQGLYKVFANPSLNAFKTSYYDFGFIKVFGGKTALDVKLFYKYIQGLPQINVTDSETVFRFLTYTNNLHATILGGTFMVEFDGLNGMYGKCGFTLQSATGNAQDYYNVGNSSNTSDLSLEQDQHLTAVTILGYNDKSRNRFFGLNTSILFRFDSGMRYTPRKDYTAVFATNLYSPPTGELNSAVLPFTTSLDIKVERGFHFNNISLSVFIWGINILNRENINYVYPSTGTSDDDGFLSTQAGKNYLESFWTSDLEFGKSIYKSRLADPYNYGSPRQIRIGLSVEF